MNQFEKYIREKLLRHKTALDTEDLWAAIERKRRRRRLLLWWQFGGGGALVLAISLATFFTVKNNQKAHFSKENAPNTTEITVKNTVINNTIVNVTPDEKDNSLKNEVVILAETNERSAQTNNDSKDKINLVFNNEKNASMTKKGVLSSAKSRIFYTSKNVQSIKNQTFSEDFLGKKSNENLVLNEIKNATQTENNSENNLTKSSEEQKVMKDEKAVKNTFLLLPTIESLTVSTLVFDDKKTFNLEKTLIKPKKAKIYEVFVGIGGGFPKRNPTAQNQEKYGTTKAIEYWTGSVSVQRMLPKQFFISAGVQANRVINRLDWKGALVGNVKYPDSLRFIALNSAGNAYIAKGDFKVIRTTERNVRQYQYLDNYNLSVGIGKQWQSNIFRYQLGTDFSAGINSVKGMNLDDKGFLQNIDYQKFSASANLYGQVNIPLRHFNMIWIKAAYWQTLTAIDEAKYNSFFLQTGFYKRF